MKGNSTKQLFEEKWGFTLLLALLVTSIILAISLSVFGIIIREISLSGSARESRLAFYAANAGIECAIYWDFVENAFSAGNPTTTSITCNGQSFDVGGPSGPNVINNLALDNGACAFEVEVLKYCVDDATQAIVTCDPDDTTQHMETTINSRGHNTCTGGFVVERGLRAHY